MNTPCISVSPRMSDLVKEFVQKFPGMYLPVWLSQFSLPTPLGEHQNPLGESEKQVRRVLFDKMHSTG